jgi:hypothetical protein
MSRLPPAGRFNWAARFRSGRVGVRKALRPAVFSSWKHLDGKIVLCRSDSEARAFAGFGIKFGHAIRAGGGKRSLPQIKASNKIEAAMIAEEGNPGHVVIQEAIVRLS